MEAYILSFVNFVKFESPRMSLTVWLQFKLQETNKQIHSGMISYNQEN
jgi:hypothetical protein